MKSLRCIYLVIFLLLSIKAKSQCKLQIEILNLRNSKGVILMELFDADHKSVRGTKGIIQNNKCTITIDNLKTAKYAIRYFHDENSNDKFDTNWMGLPSEGYGFSNNAFGGFGPKPFNNWLFEVKANTKITMKIKN